jgi:eukaryotic-like serine/threonine-protein kinase
MNQGMPAHAGRYELLSLLGEGGMARAYLAVARGQAGFDKLVVVKRIRPELASDQEFLGMFLDESRIAVRLHHPNVVHTHEVFEDEGQHVLVLEYLEGHTLAELLRRVGRAQMPLEEHLWVLCQVLAGLHHAHQLADYDGQPLGIIHRDVSPSNVFITYDGAVKLMDFGIAKAAGAVSSTERGTVKGKLGYGAPEQFRAGTVDARADVYSVGVMLWEALARRRRKTAETRPAIIEARVAGQEPKIREVCPDAPLTLAELCDRATALDPRHRPPTAAALQFQLERYLAGAARQAGRVELGELVSRLFRNERLTMLRRIEQQLAGGSPTPLPAAPAGPPSASSASASASTSGASASLGDSVIQPPSHSQLYSLDAQELPPTTWNQHRRLLVGGGIGAAAVALVATLYAVSGRAPAPIAQPAPPQAPAVAVDRASAPAHAPAVGATAFTGVVPPRAPGATGTTVELTISAEPRNATLKLDDELLDGNPYRGSVARDRRLHVVRASAPGFATAERQISFEVDSKVELVLRPAGRAATRGRGLAAGGDLSVVPPPVGEPPLRAPRGEGGGSRAPRIEPGADLPAPERAAPRRQLDEQDPYR